MGTRNFWDPTKLNGRGEGIGICVIDTGFGFRPPLVRRIGNGTPTGTGVGSYVRGNTTISGATPQTTFPTAKVIWGWDVVGDDYNGGFATPPVHSSRARSESDGRERPRHGLLESRRRLRDDERRTSLIRDHGMRPNPRHSRGHDQSLARHRAAGRALCACAFSESRARRLFRRTQWISRPRFTSGNSGPANDPLPPRLAALTGAAPIPRTPVLSILSMSLGDDAGLDYVGDPDTDSANNATAAGLSVLAAAGNADDNYYNAGTPANATGAISVAASLNGQGATIADSMASYSSRGPRPSDSKLKPDITGPAEAVSTASVGTQQRQPQLQRHFLRHAARRRRDGAAPPISSRLHRGRIQGADA